MNIITEKNTVDNILKQFIDDYELSLKTEGTKTHFHIKGTRKNKEPYEDKGFFANPLNSDHAEETEQDTPDQIVENNIHQFILGRLAVYSRRNAIDLGFRDYHQIDKDGKSA